MRRQGTTLASIEAAHRLRLASKTVVRRGSEKLSKLRPKTIVTLPTS